MARRQQRQTRRATGPAENGAAEKGHIARLQVTLVFPGASGREYSLIIDGDAKAYDDHVEVTPTWAVMHRPAIPSE